MWRKFEGECFRTIAGEPSTGRHAERVAPKEQPRAAQPVFTRPQNAGAQLFSARRDIQRSNQRQQHQSPRGPAPAQLLAHNEEQSPGQQPQKGRACAAQDDREARQPGCCDRPRSPCAAGLRLRQRGAGEDHVKQIGGKIGRVAESRRRAHDHEPAFTKVITGRRHERVESEILNDAVDRHRKCCQHRDAQERTQASTVRSQELRRRYGKNQYGDLCKQSAPPPRTSDQGHHVVFRKQGRKKNRQGLYGDENFKPFEGRSARDGNLSRV